MKRLVVMAMLVLALVLGLGVSGAAEEEDLPTHSPSSLAEYDGLDGAPAYVALDGYVYDVSDVFSEGTHGGFEAGQELTEEMVDSPHGMDPAADRDPVGVFLALELTLDELAAYDGRGGQPAYVAVDGLIYDVSDSGRWSGGMHYSNRAGQDLTQEIKEDSPHGLRTLANVTLIGVVVEPEQDND